MKFPPLKFEDGSKVIKDNDIYFPTEDYSIYSVPKYKTLEDFEDEF